MKKILENGKLFYLILFVLFLFLCFLFPYTHDDYAWGSCIGISRLYGLFDNYNGRWLGNLVILLLSRSLIIKSVIMSLVLVLIFYLIERIVGNQNKIIVRLLAPILFFLMPSPILKEGIVWTSAFANYVFPVLFFLIYLNYNKDIFSKNNNYNKMISMLLLFSGFACSLFIENITLFNLFLSFAITIYLFVKNKKIHLPNLMYFIGSFLGSILMFSNKGYYSVATGTDDYRTLNILGNAASNILDTILNYVTFQNVFLNIILSVIIILIISKNYKKLNKKVKSFVPVIILLLVSFPIYTLFSGYYVINIFLNYTKYINALYSLIYLLTVLISIILFIDKKEDKYKLILLCFIIIGVNCPLIIVTPIGPRCFVITYFLFILLVELLLKYYLTNTKCNYDVIINVLCSVFIVLFVFYSLIYGYVYKINVEREKYILDHKNDNYMILPQLPYKKFVYNGYPRSDIFTKRFKYFYKIDEKTKIEFVPIKKWYKEKK